MIVRLLVTFVFLWSALSLSAHGEEHFSVSTNGSYSPTGSAYVPTIRKIAAHLRRHNQEGFKVPIGAVGINDQGQWIDNRGEVVSWSN